MTTPLLSSVDYSTSGLDIGQAMLRAHKASGIRKLEHPARIVWVKIEVQTYDWIAVDAAARVRLELLSWRGTMRQGVDMQVDGGFVLADGSRVQLLRTWRDDRYEDSVSYDFTSRDGVLRVCNVSERILPTGKVVTDSLTGNAGMWIERISPDERIYRCSAAPCDPPDFESLTFRVLVGRHS
ncbi:MAG: hypothetical protein EON54_26420 [Alcaligenaceae bacterium]|nr:MAG: hypothetical protein EON54_26420 [Alcaligenaceae bacterium]